LSSLASLLKRQSFAIHPPINMPFNADDLLVLLKASSPEAVENVLVDAWRYRHDGISETRRMTWKSSLGDASDDDVCRLVVAADQLVRDCVYKSSDEKQMETIFPANFHKNLKKLLGKLIGKHLSSWRSDALSNQVSAPKLLDFGMCVSLCLSVSLSLCLSVSLSLCLSVSLSLCLSVSLSLVYFAL
jgi:hypothetical protein